MGGWTIFHVPFDAGLEIPGFFQGEKNRVISKPMRKRWDWLEIF